jgi:MFS family permease
MESRYRAWLFVGIMFVALGVAFSARSSLGLLMPVFSGELGWPRESVSAVGALALLVMAAVAPLVGSVVDRRGAGIVLMAGLACVGLGFLWMARTEALWELVVNFGAVGGVGFGIVATHVVATSVAAMFSARRGLATGIATAGATAGQLLVVPALAFLMTEWGWRLGVGAIALVALTLAPLAGMLAGSARHSSTQLAGTQLRTPVVGTSLRDLLTNRSFQLLFWSFAICGFSTAGVIETHLLPYAIACGFLPVLSASAYGLLSAFNMAGMVFAGYLADLCNRRVLLSAIYLLRATTFLLLLHISGDVRLLFLFAAAFGLVDYATVPITASLVASHLGLRVMGLSLGLISTGHSLGAAAGAYLGGYLFDRLGSYQELWLSAGVLAVVAGGIVLMMPDAPEQSEIAPHR